MANVTHPASPAATAPALTLITGSGGFIGRALRARAEADGARCLGVDRQPPASGVAASAAESDTPPAHAVIDLAAGPAELAALLDAWRPQLIVHLAGGTPRGVDLFVANVIPARHLFQAIASVPGYSPRVLSTGSAAEYGDLGDRPISEEARERPVGEYGVAKLAQTRLALIARRRGLRVTVARPFNLIGPGMGDDLAPARFARLARAAAASGERWITTGDLTPLRDYLGVEQVVDALWRLGTSPAAEAEEIVNICSGAGISMGAILEEILRQLGLKLDVRTDPKLVRGPLDIPVSIGDGARLAATTGLRFSFDLTQAISGLLA